MRPGAVWLTALALAFVSRAEPVRLGTATFREVRPACWEGISIYRDLKYGPRGDAPGEGPGYKSAITAQTPDGRWYHTHRTGQFCDVIVPTKGYAETAPVYVHFHGGAWCQASDKDGESMAYLKRYADLGYVVVNADYMMPMDLLDGTRKLVRTPNATFLTMLRDIDTLASWLKRDLLPAIGVKPTKFIIGGGSAGGHLAALYGYDQANPGHIGAGLRHEYPVGLVIDVVGPTDLASDDFTKPFLKGEIGVLTMFNEWAVDRLVTLLSWLTDDDLRARIGRGDIDGVRKVLARYSPNRMVTENTPPTVLAYCRLAPWSDTDGCVPTSTYDDLMEKLEAAGVPHRGDLRSWRPHGWLRDGFESWLVENVNELVGEGALKVKHSALEKVTVAMDPGELWWGGANFFSRQMPFDASTALTIDLRKDNYHNQGASLLLSNRGRVISCERPATIALTNGTIAFTADAPVRVGRAGNSLRDAYLHAMREGFPPKGRIPPAEFFTAPQLNTWIELTYHQNQRDILAYAKEMLANGVPPGVIMIDDTWQAGYGDWRFEPSRFPNPKAMVDELHAIGFKVMIWMCPYIGMDLPAFRRIAWGRNPDDVRGYPTKGGFLVSKATGEPAACSWWNGYSAFLDFSHPNARAWFAETLDGLVRDFGVDGFKLDGADLTAYDLTDRRAHDPTATNASLEKGYVSYALRYPYSEIRNTVGMRQEPVVVRLHDKRHSWDSLPRIVADMIGAGLLGYPFICPDMVGGGEWTSFIPGAAFDAELFLRSAQVHALCPMMQISASPWRVLNDGQQAVFRQTVALRQKFAPKILKLAEQAAKDGEPILRSLEYACPNQGYAMVRDEFLMGEDLLVAPQLVKGATSRQVVVPPGHWQSDRGETVVGPAEITVPTPLDRLPYFVKTRK